MCDAVTGLADAAGDARASLEWLERNNLFLLSVDEEHRWFRYHHLFRRLLLDQLEQQRGRAEMNALHERASAWFGQNGYAEEALQHALAADATAAAVQIVARYRRELTNEEQWQRLDRWVRLFPPEVIDREPELLLAEVWFMVNRQHLAGIPPLLDRVEAVLAQGTIDAATARRLQGEVEIRRATLYFYAGDHGRSLASCGGGAGKGARGVVAAARTGTVVLERRLPGSRGTWSGLTPPSMLQANQRKAWRRKCACWWMPASSIGSPAICPA